MRDFLTILAGLLIVVLAAILAAPPLLNWEHHRGFVESALSRLIGEEVRTEGALDIRLLPSPRIRARRLIIGSSSADAPSLDATYVRIEVALSPLLSGEVRFRETRIGRAEIKLPTGAGGDWRLPRRLASQAGVHRQMAFDDVAVHQFLVTTVDPRTGRTDQALADGVRIQGASLAGPWRLEGSVDAVPFELALGEIGADLSAPLKIGGGGGALPRFDIDGRVELKPAADDMLVPRFAGTGRITVAPLPATAGPARPPVRAQATVTASGRTVELANLTVEAGETAQIRLAGEGRYRIDDPRLTLSLAGRRVDLAGFWSAYAGGLGPGLRGWRPPSGMPIELAVKLDSLAIGSDEELSEVALRLEAQGARLRIVSLEASGPGGSSARISGEVLRGDAGTTAATLTTWPIVSSQFALKARDSDRLGRFLAPFGLVGAAALLDGRPFEATGDVTVAEPVVSLRNLRLAIGGTRVTGATRYTAADRGGRARLDAQLGLEGVDVASLPEGGPLFEALRDVDLGITIDARDVAYGAARGGRIAGRFSTDGPAVLVERLEIRNLASAVADLSGRILPDGSGRIEGRLRADRAAPLVDLFGRAWLGGLVRLVPEAVRDGPVDLSVKAERVAGDPGTFGGEVSSLRTSLEGRLAGGSFSGSTLSSNGLVADIKVSAATEDSAAWLGQLSAGAAKSPGSGTIAGRRIGGDRFAFALRGDLAGLQVASTRPLELGGEEGQLNQGEVEVTSVDASRLLSLAFGIPSVGGVPVDLRVTVSRDGDMRVGLTGKVANETVSAEVSGPSLSALNGAAILGRVSLPWVSSTLAFRAPVTGRPGEVWPGARFGRWEPPPMGGTVRVKTAALELGAGLVASEAGFLLTASPDGFRIGELDAAFAGGRVRGQLGVSRQGGLASLIGDGSFDGVPLGQFLGAPFGPGRVSGTLRFGGSGESVSGIVGSLGGAGEVTLDGVSVTGADPDAVARVAARVLRSDDPLASARWQPLLAEELNRGPLAANRTTANASMTGGVLRMAPLRADSAAGSWQGSAAIDLRSLTIDVRGALQSSALPPRWSGGPPAITLGWSGPVSRPVRAVDPGLLVNALAGVVLARELDRIETFELDAAERARRNSQSEMDRKRRLDAEEAARQARLKAEAEERARLEAERQRQEAERREAERKRQEDRQRPEERRPTEPDRLSPLDIRPQPAR